MYSLADYGSMIADRVRMDPYAFALKRAVKPNSVVLDIGAATGIHSLLAAKFGAKKVYAVEPNDGIHLAKRMAEANGFGDQIEFIQDLSTNVKLPEPANIVVSDLRGVLPLFSYHIPALIDARERHLSQDGVLIPHQDTMWAALVESTHVYRDIIQPWDLPYGLKMEEAKAVVLNGWYSNNTDEITSRSLFSKPEIWAVLDYSSLQQPNVVSSEITSVAKRDGTAHGILVWFDAKLLDDIGFSNGPLKQKIAEVYGRAFFPLFEPVEVQAGDSITFSLSAELVGNEYIWGWRTKIHSGNNRKTVKADFNQSTDYFQRLLGNRLSDVKFDTVPVLGEDGQVDRFILGEMDSRTSIEKIAQAALTNFPGRFQNKHTAVQYVFDLVQYYRE